nr:Gldg family protein [Kofleriaceae bacterium]
MTGALRVARRELVVTLRAPVVYVVGGLFLVVQGIAFAALLGAMADPRRPAPLGELLEGQLAGTLLTWVLELVVLTLLGMRAVADERRSGGWELLLTARVSEGAAIVGKWLAATAIYALLWLPTLAYFAVVAAFRSDGGGWDLASIAAGYGGAIAIGAALLAWAIAASAATSTPLAAGALGFAVLIALFLVGELGAVWPELATAHPALAAALDDVSLRQTAAAFARGELSLAAVVRVAGLAATGLSLAIALACAGRRRRADVRVRLASTLAVAAIAGFGALAAARHPVRWDVSADRRSTLDPATRDVLANLPARASIEIIEPTLAELEPVYAEVARVADLMAEVAPIDVTRVDPADVPGGTAAVARAGGLSVADLASHGAVVVAIGARRVVVDRVALASYDVRGDAVSLAQLAIEQQLAGALAQLAQPTAITACATSGHGELPMAPPDAGSGGSDSQADWRIVADRLRGDGMTVDTIEPSELSDRVPARCAVLIVAGPIRPLSATEALAIQHFVAAGGGLLVAAAARPGPTGGLVGTGLESMLDGYDLAIPTAIAVDPLLAVREIPGALLVSDGYSDHPIDRGFARARATLWFPPRVVAVRGRATPLVSASAESYGETDVEHEPHRDETDLPGPSVLAAVGSTHGGARVVVVGSAESFSTAVLAGGASAGDLWLDQAVRWLAGVPDRRGDIAARTPAQVRLVMTSAQRTAAIATCVGGIPLAWTLFGGAFVWWRRRRRAS